MEKITVFLQEYNNQISSVAAAANAAASIVIVWLTRALSKYAQEQSKWTEASAKITNALMEIERQRDSSGDPRVFVWCEGYDTVSATCSFVCQNSGGRKLFLRSLRVIVPNSEIDFLQHEDSPESYKDISGQLNDIVISTDKVERFHFRYKSGWGSHFEIIAQLYTGTPVRLTIDPNMAAGYELRAIGSTELRAYRDGFQVYPQQ